MAAQDFQNDYSKEGLQDMLLSQAVSFEAWKERLRRRLLVKKVIEEDLLKDVSVSPEEIKTYFYQHGDDWAHGEALKVRHIMTLKKDEADRVLEELKTGEDFASLARLHSAAR